MRDVITKVAALLWLIYSNVVPCAAADDLESARELVRQAERRRIELIERVTPAVVCVYDKAERGGGSGVIIDPEGYGLTNFHVVAKMVSDGVGRGGLSDGWVYDIEILGIDPTGDVAMFRMTGKEEFPHVPLGDSDEVRVGDPGLVLGNPFVLSEDQSPSVSYGIVTGVDRYQAGVKGNLTYTDCLQVDAPVNPGNSGGPLFNDDGEVIGINGRISVNTRGRFNVGFGYAISSNQIARFIPTMRAGLMARHGTLDISVDDVEGVGVMVNEVRGGGAADRAGLRAGDVLLTFDGEPVPTRNRYASLLGTYPADWPVIVEVRRDGKRKRHFARLDPIEPRMRGTYEPRRAHNVRQIRRTLERYRHSVRGDGDGEVEATFPAKWTVTRTDLNDAQADRQRYVASLGRRQREYEDGRRGALIEVTDASALRFPVGGGEPTALPLEEQMLLSARFLLWEMARSGFADELPERARHVGGDALVRPLSERRYGGPHADRGQLLEVIEWPVSEKGVAHFAFDAASGRIRRVTVRDRVTNFAASIYFSDFTNVGASSWPGLVEVYTTAEAYVEQLSEWGDRVP